MNRLCTVCARGGSKGVKGKNTRLIGDKPLLWYTIRTALESRCFDTLSVSSDSREILEIARECGATMTIERPAELATDSAAKIPSIRHCVEQTEIRLGKRFDIVVDLDATSPLRTPEDIVACIDILERDTSASNVITAMPSRRSPYFNMIEQLPEGGVRLCKPLPSAVTRRQDAPQCFDMNASIYTWRRDALNSDSLFSSTTRLYVMPEERSWDIDSEFDFRVVEFLLTNKPDSAL